MEKKEYVKLIVLLLGITVPTYIVSELLNEKLTSGQIEINGFSWLMTLVPAFITAFVGGIHLITQRKNIKKWSLVDSFGRAMDFCFGFILFITFWHVGYYILSTGIAFVVLSILIVLYLVNIFWEKEPDVDERRLLNMLDDDDE